MQETVALSGDGKYSKETFCNEISVEEIVARLKEEMTLNEHRTEVLIIDRSGEVLLDDHVHCFFEASWVHKYNGKYYFSYSTKDTHFICYAIGDKPNGPYVFHGKILNPVGNWASNHSILEVENEWYLVYFDESLSQETNLLQNRKVTKIDYLEDGSIISIDSFGIRRLFD